MRAMDREQWLRSRQRVSPGNLRPHCRHRRPRCTVLSTSHKRLQRQYRVGIQTGRHTRSGGSGIHEGNGQSTNLALRPGTNPVSRPSESTGPGRRRVFKLIKLRPGRRRVLKLIRLRPGRRRVFKLIRLRHRVQREKLRPTISRTSRAGSPKDDIATRNPHHHPLIATRNPHHYPQSRHLTRAGRAH